MFSKKFLKNTLINVDKFQDSEILFRKDFVQKLWKEVGGETGESFSSSFLSFQSKKGWEKICKKSLWKNILFPKNL